MKRLALLSVTDKTGIVAFAKGLEAKNFEILSTGGTAELLRSEGVDVTGVSYYTGMPEILGGRVKTLHPKLHGGLLAKPEDAKHCEEMEELNIRRIEVAAVNLYPFEDTVKKGASLQEAIENIDIGGPAMIRAAAKNADNVLVLVDPGDYDDALRVLDSPGARSLQKRLQAKAFSHTAFYDALVAEYLNRNAEAPQSLRAVGLRLKQALRYGENPHQSAQLYLTPFQEGGVANAEQVCGKDLSYNNLLDADAAWELACALDKAHEGRHHCVIVKHGNPCGAGWSREAAASFLLAREGDPLSAFGGIVAVMGELSIETAEAMTEKGNFFEVVVCGSITPAALDVFRNRQGWGQDVRVLAAGPAVLSGYKAIRSIRGGVLLQDADVGDSAEFRPVTTRRPDAAEMTAANYAWTVVAHVKSNAIAVAGEARLLGVGAGQMSRVRSVQLALEQAGKAAAGAALASDAFFPFPDSLELAAKAGIGMLVQPGGSKKDPEVIEAANRLGLAMVFTGVRHFRH